ncbi:hypothetical protein [Nocardia sp. MDA0666]|nr:hypothetical protein [Nocardia sp. MDA0666]
MTAASPTGNVSTVEELLMISPAERRDRTTRAEAVRRWSSEDQR